MASPSSTPADPAAPAARQLLGLLCVSCATLLLQAAWTRVLSVSLWYHFAFLVVSTALLGFGLSGVLLTLSRRLASLDLDRGLPRLALLYALTTLGGFWLANRIPFAPFSLLADPIQLLYTPLYLLCIAGPFVLSGLCAALLLSRIPAHAGRIYFFDLLGAGLGCLLLLPVMPICGGSGTLVACAALASLGAACFAPPRLRAIALPLLAAALLGALAPSPLAERLFPIRISQAKTVGSGPTIDREIAGPENLFTSWNTFSRIDVLPASYGRRILIDAGTAMTRMPRLSGGLDRLPPLEDERLLALQNESGPAASVLVIGSGGGWDVLAALRGGARRVIAVEVNPLINELVERRMAEFVGGLFSDPRVELRTAEARSFIRRSRELYDAILASHTISNAATASGALNLAEDYVMTREAFADYVSHLSPRGRLWFTRPEAQLPRMVATAREALAGIGIEDAASRVVVFASGRPPSFYGGLLLSREPLAAAELERARALFSRARLRTLYAPGAPDPATPYRELLTADPAGRARLYRESPTLLEPASDDRPFFSQRARWSTLGWSTIRRTFDQGGRTRMALEDQPIAEAVLALVLIQSGLLALLLIVLPLAVRLRGVERSRFRLLLYFLCLGLGFILCEIALIQRFTLFLGQPIYTFAVVVGTLLLASGLGSLLSSRLIPEGHERSRLLLLLGAIAATVACVAVLGPLLLQAALGLPLAARVLCAAAILTPLGLLLGMPFPVALRHAGRSSPGVIPWAWGLNAVASVVGSVLAMVLATMIGFSGVLLLAGGAYLAAALCDPARE